MENESKDEKLADAIALADETSLRAVMLALGIKSAGTRDQIRDC